MKRDLKRLHVEEDSLRHHINGRDELNLAEFPFTLLTDRVPPGCKTIYFEDQIVDRSTKESISRKVTMTGSDEYGLPTAIDGDILIGLIQLTKSYNNFADPRIAFSRYELIKLLGWADESKSYHRIEESLNRWIGVTYYYTAWRDKETETWTNEKFHLLDNVSLVDQARRRTLVNRGQAELALSWFKWNEVIFKSFQAGYLKPLDLVFYYGLRSSIAKQIYRYVDKHFGVRHTDDLVFELNKFAFEKVGISRNYDTGKIKEKLQPAIKELETQEFLEPMSREERYFKEGRDWKIRLRQRVKPSASATLPLFEISPPPLVTALTSRGVTEKTAVELVQQFPADFVAGKIEEFDWEMTQPKPPKKPAGYLVKSIRDGYATDPNFISTAERERRAAATRQREEAAAAARRQQREQDAAEKAERQAINAYRKGLTPAQLAEHEAAAVAQADATMRQTLEQAFEPNIRRMLLGSITDEHIRHLLRKQTEPA